MMIRLKRRKWWLKQQMEIFNQVKLQSEVILTLPGSSLCLIILEVVIYQICMNLKMSLDKVRMAKYIELSIRKVGVNEHAKF